MTEERLIRQNFKPLLKVITMAKKILYTIMDINSVWLLMCVKICKKQ